MASTITDADTNVHNFVTIAGLPDPMGHEVEVVHRPGSDGIAYRVIGHRSDEFVLRTSVDHDNIAATLTAIEAYKALQGTLITVLDDRGRTWVGLLVLNVREITARKIVGADSGVSTSKGAWQVCEWRCRVTELPS